ncbi:hypothetical protein ACHAWF_006186 [Thalassiosira exigua]
MSKGSNAKHGTVVRSKRNMRMSLLFIAVYSSLSSFTIVSRRRKKSKSRRIWFGPAFTWALASATDEKISTVDDGSFLQSDDILAPLHLREEDPPRLKGQVAASQRVLRQQKIVKKLSDGESASSGRKQPRIGANRTTRKRAGRKGGNKNKTQMNGTNRIGKTNIGYREKESIGVRKNNNGNQGQKKAKKIMTEMTGRTHSINNEPSFESNNSASKFLANFHEAWDSNMVNRWGGSGSGGKRNKIKSSNYQKNQARKPGGGRRWYQGNTWGSPPVTWNSPRWEPDGWAGGGKSGKAEWSGGGKSGKEWGGSWAGGWSGNWVEKDCPCTYVPARKPTGSSWGGGWGGAMIKICTCMPTYFPTYESTYAPTTYFPTNQPTTSLPTRFPSNTPTNLPTMVPTVYPTRVPTMYPTNLPTLVPTLYPTNLPTVTPSFLPTLNPTLVPTHLPTVQPTLVPTLLPTLEPTLEPTLLPPTFYPTISP